MAEKKDADAKTPHGDEKVARPGGAGDRPVNETPQIVSKTEAERADKLKKERQEIADKRAERVEENADENTVLPGERPTRSRRDEAIHEGLPMDEALRPDPNKEQEAVFRQTGTIPPQIGGHESTAYREGLRPENVEGMSKAEIEGTDRKELKAGGKTKKESEVKIPRNPSTGSGERSGGPQDPGV